MNEPLYDVFNPIEIDNEPCLLQAIEFEDETIFLVKRNNEIFCVIMLDENNKWQPDIEMSETQFQQIMHWIMKLYFNG